MHELGQFLSSARNGAGSTPLTSFLSLFACEPIQTLLERESPLSLPYVVLGSSLGWLAFYGACIYRFPTTGIELMPNLVSAADRVARIAGVEGIRFECADALCCDLSTCMLVVLASQCWDKDLLSALHGKLLSELPEGALVLDYTSPLCKNQKKKPCMDEKLKIDVQGMRNTLQLSCTVTAPVSWNGAQTFWVWKVVGSVLTKQSSNSLDPFEWALNSCT